MGRMKYTELVPEMRRLRELGWTYMGIEKELGIRDAHGKIASSYLNPERRTRHNERTRKWVGALRSGILALYGGKCSECGESTPEVLQLNHIHGDGAEERRRYGSSGRGYSYQHYAAILKGEKNKDDYNLLCANCNILYEYKRGRLTGQSPEHAAIITMLGGKCAECGIADGRILQINHIYGGGVQESAAYGGHSQGFHRAIINGERSTDDLNVLCVNHNRLFKPKLPPTSKLDELKRNLKGGDNETSYGSVKR